MYALTVLTPIAPGEAGALRETLAGFAERRPLSEVGGTHFGRWLVVEDFVTGAGQSEKEDLGGPYLLFSATFDGALDPYLDAFCTRLPDVVTGTWGRCIGCPDVSDVRAVKAYVRHNQIDTGLFFAAYPDADVASVQRSLRARERLIDLALDAPGMGADALRARFLEEFAS
jgi:hypothetical protein